MGLWEDLKDMPREDVIDLLYEYDKYIQYANDEDLFYTGWRPVCLAEFYDIEFPIVMEERSSRDQSNEEGPRNPGWKSIPEPMLGESRMGPGMARDWSVGDVLSLDDSLTEDEAYEVLEIADKEFSAEFGINWDVLEEHIWSYKESKGANRA